MQIHDLALRVVTMRDAGLIGDDEDEISPLVEQANCARDAGHPTDPLGRSDVSVVVVDNAVSIEKRGGPSGMSGIAGVQQGHRYETRDVPCTGNIAIQLASKSSCVPLPPAARCAASPEMVGNSHASEGESGLPSNSSR